MRKASLLIATALVLLGATTSYALYSIADTGTWPKTWPTELEPLRKQSRTAAGPTIMQRHYDIPCKDQAEFEKVWPHLLAVKSEGAPIILMPGPNKWLGNTIQGGVRIHCPPSSRHPEKDPVAPKGKIINTDNPRVRWMNRNYIELIVDGKIVDLNRIELPPDTPIIDERFKKK